MSEMKFAPAEWPDPSGVAVPAPVLEIMRHSWAKATEVAGRKLGQPFSVDVADDKAELARKRELRAAAKQLGIGVSIRVREADGKRELLFRAAPPRTRRTAAES